MATAKKTPSGMWKCRVYSHTTSDGKKHYRAFTAPTKQEAEQQAARFSGSADRAAHVDLTVSEAIEGYISSRDGVLSPSTIRGYRQMQKNYYADIGHIKLRKLNNAIVQTFVSDLAKKKSSKSVMNIYGLLTSAVKFYSRDHVFDVKLPAKEIKRGNMASESEILNLYQAADDELKICIGLSAFGSLRRGEICALEYGDITGTIIFVHSDLVRDDKGKWIKKPTPKTLSSARYVSTIPPEIFDLIGTGAPDERIIKTNPNEITKRFCRLRDRLGYAWRFQDMRGFFASSAPLLGVPDVYTSDFGGWRRGSQVLKNHYQKSMTQMSDKYAGIMRDYFSGMLSQSESMTENMTQK